MFKVSTNIKPKSGEKADKIIWFALAAIILAGLYWVSRIDYLLFHSLTELFSVIVAAGIFMIAWNTRRYFDNRYFLFLGIAYLFIGTLDLVHTLAYQGMGVFAIRGSNIPTQIWIAARYLESLSFLVAPIYLVRKNIKPGVVFFAFGSIVTLILAAIFVWHNFPTAYVEGSGLTAFKVTSEYIISLFLLGSMYLLYKSRHNIDQSVYRLVQVSILLTIISEMAFTLYTDPFGLSNVAGHLLKVVSFYLIYRALVATGMLEPFRLLFRNLKASEERAVKGEAKYRQLFTHMASGFALHMIITGKSGQPIDYVFVEVNQAFEALTGLKRKDILGRRVTEVIPGIGEDPTDWIGRYGRVANGCKSAKFEQYAAPLKRWYEVIAYCPRPGYFATVIDDVTERKHAQEKVIASEKRLKNTLDNMIEGCQIITPDWRYLYVNDAAARQGRLPRRKYLGKTMPELYPGIERTDMFRALKKCLREQTTVVMENMFEYPDGKKSWFELSIQPVPEGLFVLSVDITERRRAEEAMRNLSLFPEQNPFPILRIDKQGLLMYANHSSRILLDHWHCRVGQPIPPDIFVHVAEAFRTGKITHFETSCGPVAYSLSIASIPSQGYANMYGLDVTERNIAEEKLRRSEYRYRELVQNSNSAIIRWQVDGTIMFINEFAEKFFGYGIDEIVGKKVDMLLPKKISAEYNPAELISDIAVHPENYANNINENILRDGRRVWMAWTNKPIFDRDGKVSEILAIGSDITERINMENDLRKHAALLDLANDPIVVFDADKNIRFWNQGAARNYGYSKEAAAGKNIQTLLKTEFPLSFEKIMDELTRRGEWRGELRQTTSRGNKIIVDSRLVMNRDHSANTFTVMEINMDITERKKTEEQINRYNRDLSHYARQLKYTNQELEAFTYSVSHDLRAPLRAIDGFSQALLEDYEAVLDDQGRDYLGRVRRGSQKMSQLIDDLLRLSRISRQELHTAVFDISSLARETARELSQAAPGRNVDLTIQPDLEATGDRDLIRIVLNNLLSNAWKYTADRDLANIEFGKVNGSGHSTFYVRDNGIGLNLAYSDRLFQPFQRLHPDGHFEGSGIGLAIVHRIITRHGGRVWVESEEGKGATFYFSL